MVPLPPNCIAIIICLKIYLSAAHFLMCRIITLYVSVVLVIGRFIRTYVADLPYQLAVNEILNPDPLIRLCDDIYTVRERGKLELEEILVGKLFYIFRSSERIVRITEDLKEKTD